MPSLYMNRIVEVDTRDGCLRLTEDGDAYTALFVTPHRHSDPKHLFHFADQLERAAYQMKQAARDKLKT